MPLKLLDYGNLTPFGEIIGRQRNLAWPVNAYRVTLPKVSTSEKVNNPFDRVILKIIDAGGAQETEVLAQETCLPVDFVQCVLLRLRDKDFISGYNEIIEESRDDWAKGDAHAPDYVTALLFRELVTGKILPFYHQLDDTPLQKKEGDEKFFRNIRWNRESKHCHPTPRDVITALRTMMKRSRAFAKEMRLPAVQHIIITHDPEQCLLDCPIAIQKSDGEFRIADPFGNGFSLLLENAFRRLLEQDQDLSRWYLDWRKRLSNPQQNKWTVANKEPYDNETNQGRYPNLVINLRLQRNTQHRSIEQIHATLEWALFYSCAQRQYDTAVKQLRYTNQTEHPNLLMVAAERVGLIPPRSGFRPVWEGKLDDFLSGKAWMDAVLSLALLMAGEDGSHPLHHISTKHQDFIIQIFDIKKKRNAPGHGRGRVNKGDIELPEEAFMRDIITALLPTILFSDTPVMEIPEDTLTDSLLDATTSIIGEFGFNLYNRIGEDLKNRLIHAERFWLSCENAGNALYFACDVYAALQAVFWRRLSAALSPAEIQDSGLVTKAAKNAADAGLQELPASLRTVKVSAIRETLQGNDQSLGSCVVAFLLATDADTLSSIADIQPSFISDVAEIIARRGHGNDPLPLPKTDIFKLRNAAYSTIKTLLES